MILWTDQTYLEYSSVFYTIRHIKFTDFCEYKIKKSDLKIQALSEDISQIEWYLLFFTKITKMPDLGFGTSYKDGLCPKLEKNLEKPKLSPQNVLYDSSCPLLSSK